MAAFDPATDYVADWVVHDFVEDAQYESPPDSGVEWIAEVKVKIDDVSTSVAQGLVSYPDGTLAAVAWTPDNAETTLRTGGTLTTDTTSYIIRTATRSRFGHWQLTIEPLRTDGDPDA